MSNDAIETEDQNRSEREKLENELNAILEASENTGVLIRALGSLAYRIHCPKYGYLQIAAGRSYGDIDLGSYSSHSHQIRDMMTAMGYAEDREIFILSEAQRALFYKKHDDLRVEVFYDKLDFCHVVSWKNRLHVDSPTIPLAELFLEKMQIVQISERDLVYVTMLMLEHPFGKIEKETINIKLIAQLCADEWGLWRTITFNLNKIKQFAHQYAELTPEQKTKVEAQANEALLQLHAEPKSGVESSRSHGRPRQMVQRCG